MSITSERGLPIVWTPELEKKIRVALWDRDKMTVKALADCLGFSRPHVNAVVTGAARSKPMLKQICDFLDIKVNESSAS
jgi:DNA-binding Xre family transcriptional regulator